MSHEKFVEHNTKTILVTGWANVLERAVCLLRGHICWGAKNRSILGQFVFTAFQLGQPKIHQHGGSSIVYHDIRRFDITVYHSSAVRVVHCLSQLADNLC